MEFFFLSKPYEALLTFQWTLFSTFVLCLAQATGQTTLWILAFGLGTVAFQTYFPGFELSGFGLLNRFFAGLFGATDVYNAGVHFEEFFSKLILQFTGALVGSLAYGYISNTAIGPVVTGEDEDLWRTFILFTVACMAQSYIFRRIDYSKGGLDTSLQAAVAYIFVYTAQQASVTNAVGGLTVDFGRMLGMEISQKELYAHDFNRCWVVLAAPVVATLVTLILGKIEDAAKDLQNGVKANTGMKSNAMGSPVVQGIPHQHHGHYELNPIIIQNQGIPAPAAQEQKPAVVFHQQAVPQHVHHVHHQGQQGFRA